MLFMAHLEAVKADEFKVRVPCDWLPGFAWVHWTTRDLAFAFAFCRHVVGSICVARLLAVVQEVWELYFSGLVVYCCCVRSVCPAAACGAGGVGVILLWIGRLCVLTLLLWTNALEAPHW